MMMIMEQQATTKLSRTGRESINGLNLASPHAMHRALSCFQTQATSLTLVGPSQSTQLLQAAVSRAWLRRISFSRARTYASGAASTSHGTVSEPIANRGGRGVIKSQTKFTQRHSTEAGLDHDPRTNPVKPAIPTVDEAFSVPSGSEAVDKDVTLAYDTKSPVVLADPSPALSQYTKLSSTLSLPPPISPQMLSECLLLASYSKPPPDVEALVRYHDSYPQFHSLESYNISIKFAISHGQYAVATRLFDDMTKGGIRFDSTTYKLLVQLHAQQSSNLGQETSNKPILRRRSTSLMKMLSVIRDSGPEIEPEVFLRQILSCLRPMFCGWEVHPKVVKTALHSLVHRNLYSAATELANAYFSILPAGIDEETNAECMEMVHLLMSVDTKRGIPSFYANQKLLVALLRTHSSLQPSSDTFLLLLSSLRRAKKSSTVAFEVMASFRHRWGDRVFDDRVKQHILNLAEKEGRLDIAEKIRNQ
ncbi:hypothetical protein Agabi119p4_3764 [Agaricus bisporus var. burnettii]|uniref:Pentacotripeptide-repeat region of PRORP domain-containing protein n=1 Tax=Agaricus bisporus var. burnettii TaxID=192524 RepID=A0A8H7F5F7_AGABI|nr:hypothetical protein Agabi119p4_3764 [Agaricus bisporus var. burnettii]